MTYKEYLLELKKYSPYDFSEYSDSSIQRRLQKVLEMHNMKLENLLKRTAEDPGFVEQLVNDITVNTTDFFRDPEVWEDYASNFLSKINKKKKINIWHAGCSSGQEVYSNIILLNELGLLDNCQIFATDINQQVLNQAKGGTYRLSNNIKSFDSMNRLLQLSVDGCLKPIDFSKYFDINEASDKLVFKSEWRDIPTFKKHDLVQETKPFDIKFDIVFCRNVLIYFNVGLQGKIIRMFHDYLNVSSLLLLGHHESLSGFFKTKFTKNGNVFVKNNTFNFKY